MESHATGRKLGGTWVDPNIKAFIDLIIAVVIDPITDLRVLVFQPGFIHLPIAIVVERIWLAHKLCLWRASLNTAPSL